MVNTLITGAAGFIGNKLRKSFKGNLHLWIFDKEIGDDMLNTEYLQEIVNECDMVYHLAAATSVAAGGVDTTTDFDNNIKATYNLLECMRKSPRCKTIYFTSSSTVYGDDHSGIITELDPQKPISLYGASKAACENLISGYCHMFGMKGIVFRLANVVGPTNKKGVVYDLIQKLKKDPTQLEILGDGRQFKQYLYIDDCVNALTLPYDKLVNKPFEVYNVAPNTGMSVFDIAYRVIELMGLTNKKVEFKFQSNWNGDIHSYYLDSYKLSHDTAWQPKYDSRAAVQETISRLLSP